MRGRLTHDELGGELDVVGVNPLARGQPQRRPDGDGAHLAQGLADGGERGCGQPRDRGVVEADHAQVLRDPQPSGPGGLDHSQRGLVAAREHRGRRLGQAEERGTSGDPCS